MINRNFHDRKLYLFDTSEEFDQRNVAFEERNHYSEAKAGQLNIASKMLVLSKMIYTQNCIIKKGYFPELAEEIGEKICYVNLNMDLYKPTLEGLRFFYRVDDSRGNYNNIRFFGKGYEGVKEAIREFMDEMPDDIVPFPIEDRMSIAIQKT